MRFLIPFCLVALLFTACNFKSEKADLILYNGSINTLNELNEVHKAMAIRDGKILFLGPDRAVLNYYSCDEIIDLAGKKVYPVALNNWGDNSDGSFSDQKWVKKSITYFDSLTIAQALTENTSLEIELNKENAFALLNELANVLEPNNDLRWNVNASDSVYLKYAKQLRTLALIPVVDNDNANKKAAENILGLFTLKGSRMTDSLGIGNYRKAATTFNAISYKAENDFGSLDSGKVASFAIWQLNKQGLELVQTYIAGKSRP